MDLLGGGAPPVALTRGGAIFHDKAKKLLETKWDTVIWVITWWWANCEQQLQFKYCSQARLCSSEASWWAGGTDDRHNSAPELAEQPPTRSCWIHPCYHTRTNVNIPLSSKRLSQALDSKLSPSDVDIDVRFGRRNNSRSSPSPPALQSLPDVLIYRPVKAIAKHS
jgi:hypothetical protein